MKFGVNYTPSGEWFYTWLNPKWEVIRRDLAQIAELGADHVRIFPLWTLLQPNRTWINPRHWQMFAVWSNSVEKPVSMSMWM